MNRNIIQNLFGLLAGVVFLLGSMVGVEAQTNKPITEYDEIRAELNTRNVSFHFNKQSIKNVIELVNDHVNFNLILDQRVENRLNPAQRKVTLSVNNLKLKSFLRLLLNQKGLSSIYTHGTVKIVPDGVADQHVIRYYDIRDLKFKLNDFPGPTLELRDPDEIAAAKENKTDMGGFFGDEFDKKSSLIKSNENLIDMIRELTGNTYDWSQESGSSIKIKNGSLIVKQNPQIQKEVLQLIKRLRSFR